MSEVENEVEGGRGCAAQGEGGGEVGVEDEVEVEGGRGCAAQGEVGVGVGLK